MKKLNYNLIAYIKEFSINDVSNACRSLGISRATFYNYIKKAKESLFKGEENIYTEFFYSIYSEKLELKNQLEQQLIEFSKTESKVCVYLYEKISNQLDRFEKNIDIIESKESKN